MKRSSFLLIPFLALVIIAGILQFTNAEPTFTKQTIEGNWTAQLSYITENSAVNQEDGSLLSTINFTGNEFKVVITDADNEVIREYAGEYSVDNDKLQMKLANQEKASCFKLSMSDNLIEMCPEPSLKINDNISVYLSNFVSDYKAIDKPARFAKEL